MVHEEARDWGDREKVDVQFLGQLVLFNQPDLNLPIPGDYVEIDLGVREHESRVDIV